LGFGQPADPLRTRRALEVAPERPAYRANWIVQTLVSASGLDAAICHGPVARRLHPRTPSRNDSKEGRWRRGWDSKWTVNHYKIRWIKIKIQIYPASYPVSNGHFCNPFLWKTWHVSGRLSLGNTREKRPFRGAFVNSVHGAKD
jgi:hypothetical protein